MRRTLQIISDRFEVPKVVDPERFGGDWAESEVRTSSVHRFLLDTNRLAETEVFMVVTPIENDAEVRQLGGLLSDQVHKGKLVVFAFDRTLDGPEGAFLDRLGFFGSRSRYATNTAVTPVFEPFGEFARLYGSSHEGFGKTLSAARVSLARDAMRTDSSFVEPSGAGNVAVIQFQSALFDQALPKFVEHLFNALDKVVVAANSPPEYLGDLRLYGEESLLEKIRETEALLGELEKEALELRRFRQLLGNMHGDEYVDLVVEAMNLILSTTDCDAVKDDEKFAEDFWIRRGDTNVCIGEAKGVNTGAKREHANQVDGHREKHELDSEEMPGVAVINTFRKDGDLERKERQDPAPDVIRAMRNQRVLLVRGIDLYRLLSASLAGTFSGHDFLELLLGDGGWIDTNSLPPEIRTNSPQQ